MDVITTQTDPLGLRDLFPGYHLPTSAEIAEAWKTGLVVLDTNALLDLYKLPKATREEIQDAYRAVSERIWSPFQIAMEFEFGRERVLDSEWGKVEEAKLKVEKARNSIKSAIDELHLKRRGVHEDPDRLKLAIEDASNEIFACFDAAKATYVNPKDVDSVRTFVMSLLQGRVGSPPADQAMLDALYKEGEKRYAQERPPGFKDHKTGSVVVGGLRYERKFGDLILWNQILNYFSSLPKKMDLIFVTGERKDDWWKKNVSGIHVPHPELVSEFKRECGGRTFLMYSIENFLEASKTQLATVVSESALQQVKEIQPTVVDGADLPQRFRLLEGPPIVGLDQFVHLQIHSGLTRNPDDFPTYLPKFDKSAGVFQVLKIGRAALAHRFVVNTAEDLAERFAADGYMLTTFIFHCTSANSAAHLAGIIDNSRRFQRCYFVWHTADGYMGAELTRV